MPASIRGFGRISINKKFYNIAPMENAYKVTEVPSHADVDSKMERRVIYKSFSNGILRHREEDSVDATMTSSPTYTYYRQNRLSSGIYWANGCDTRVADRIFPQRATVQSNFSDTSNIPFLIQDGSIFSYAVSTRAVYVLNGSSWQVSAVTAQNITDTVSFGGYVYVGIGPNNGFYTWNQQSATGAWVQSSFTASYFTVIRNQLWRASGANIYSTVNTNPASQVWSGATVIGDPSTPITGLDVYQDFIMIFKQDGIYSADKSGNVYPIFPGFKTLGTNPRPLGQWRDQYFFAADFGLVWAYDKNGVHRIGFDMAEPYPMGSGATAIYAIPNAATRGIPMTNYFVVGFYQSINSDQNAGAYYLAWDGQSWNPFLYVPNAITNAVGMTGGNLGITNPTLQFSYQERASGINRIVSMPNPLIDPFLSGSYDTQPQTFYLPIDNGALEDEFKVLERIGIWMDNPKAGTLRCFYALDDEIVPLTWHDMGVPTGNLSVSSQTFVPPQPFPAYRRIQLKFVLTANASNVAPIVRYVIMHYKQKIPQRKVWDVILMAERNVVSSTGRLDVRSSKQIIDDLNTARVNRQQIIFNDPQNTAQMVYIDEVGEDLKILKGGNQNPSYLVMVKMVAAVDGT